MLENRCTLFALLGFGALSACALSPGQDPHRPSEGAPDASKPTEDSGAPVSDQVREEAKRGQELGVMAQPSLEGSDKSAPLPSGTKVLHVGDSFAGALGLPLGQLLKKSDIGSVLKHTDSSYLTDWAWDGKFQKYIWRYNPDLVIITLGGNELEITEPERREKTVKKIVSQIEGRPCVWVAVPLWKGPQNGLMDVIKAHSSPCVFMDTSKILDVEEMERLSDGVHPTKAARQLWAEAALAWLQAHRQADGERPWSMTP